MRHAMIIMLAGFAIFLLASGTAFAGGAEEAEGATLTYAEVNVEADPITQGALHFATRLAELTDGRFGVEVVGGGALGGHETTMRLTETGTIEMTRTNAFFLAEAGVEVMEALSLPFMFESKDHAWEVMQGEIGAEVLNEINDADLGYYALGFYIAPPRHYFFRDAEVTSIDDMSGLSVRVPAGPLADATEAFGASATTIEFGELYSALETGVVDAAEQPVKGYYTQGFYEVAPYFTYSNHQVDPTVVLINRDLWESLDSDDQEAFRVAFEESAEHYRALEAEERVAFEEELAEQHGVRFFDVDNPDEWSDAAAHLYDQFPAYAELIERIQAAAQ